MLASPLLPQEPLPQMKSHQLIRAVGTEVQQQIVRYLQVDERAAWRGVVQSLAQRRRLRPVYVEKKSKPDQAVWVAAQLELKSNDDVTAQVLQIWLLKGQVDMLTAFLDAVGIKHDGKGQVDELPEDIPEDKATAGIEALLKDYPAKQVALYLYFFQLQRPDGWAGLTTAIEANPDLVLEVPA